MVLVLIAICCYYFQMRDLRHENLVQFFGVTVDPPNICFVSVFCPKTLKVNSIFNFVISTVVAVLLTDITPARENKYMYLEYFCFFFFLFLVIYLFIYLFNTYSFFVGLFGLF